MPSVTKFTFRAKSTDLSMPELRAAHRAAAGRYVWLGYQRLHIQLWQWCADNPHLYKEDWPGWAEHRRAPEKCHCFACMYSKPTCAACPCWWGSHAQGVRRGERKYCMDRTSLYRKYGRAQLNKHYNLARLYAERIRDAWII